MKLPDYPKKGTPVETTMRQVIDYMRSCTLRSVVGGRLSQSSGGTSIIIPPSPKTQTLSSHPWKVTPKTEGTVSVGDGAIFGKVKAETGDDTYIFRIAEWEKSDVTVTDDGYIYAAVSYDQDTGLGTISVTFETDNPDTLDPNDGEYHIPIAQVSLVDGDAKVDKQIITHNPTIQLGGESGHPWRVTNSTTAGSAAITAGFVHGYFLTYSAANPHSHASGGDGQYLPDTVVLEPSAEYAGGTLSITGTQYIYAEISRNFSPGSSNEYAEALNSSDVDVGVELYDDIDPADWSAGSPGDTIALVASDDAPDTYTPGTGKAAVCIAKVTNSSGTITVDKQYLTHNPTVFLPVIDVLVVAAPEPL